MQRYVVKRMRLAHCKRGPSRCAKCREMDVEKICLLDICPEGEMQRRVIQVGDNWHEFEIVKSFENEETARAYAAEQGIEYLDF